MNDEYNGEFEESKLSDEEFNEAEFIETINDVIEKTFADYDDKGEFFTDKADEIANRLKDNEAELTKLNEAIEKNQEAFKKLGENNSDDVLDEIYKEVEKLVLGRYGIMLDSVATAKDNINRAYNEEKQKELYGKIGDDYKTKDRVEKANLKNGSSDTLHGSKTYKDKNGKIYVEDQNNKGTFNEMGAVKKDGIIKNQNDHIQDQKGASENSVYKALGMMDSEISGMVNDNGNIATTNNKFNNYKRNKSQSDASNNYEIDKNEASKEAPINKSDTSMQDIKAGFNTVKHTTMSVGKQGLTHLANDLPKRAMGKLISELLNAFINSMREALREAGLSFKARARKFIDSFKTRISNFIKNFGKWLKDLGIGSVDSFFKSFIGNLAGVIFKVAEKVVKSFLFFIDKTIEIGRTFFNPDMSMEAKMKAIGLALVSIVGAIVIDAMFASFTPGLLRDVLELLVLSAITAFTIYGINEIFKNYNKAQKHLQLTNESLNLNAQKQMVLCQNMQLYSALAMASTGYTLDYFSKAILEIGQIYGSLFEIEKDLKESNNRLDKEIEEDDRAWEERKRLFAKSKGDNK